MNMILQNFPCLDIFIYLLTRLSGPAPYLEYNNGHVFVLRLWIGYSVDGVMLFLLKCTNHLTSNKFTVVYCMYLSASMTFLTIQVPPHLESDLDFLLMLSYFKATSTLNAAILYRLSKKAKEKTLANVICAWISCLDLSFNFAQSICSYIILLLMTFSDNPGTDFSYKQMLR